MADQRLPWFPCYPRDLLGALAEMPPEQGYVYVIVLLRIYEVRGPIKDTAEALARRAGLRPSRVEKSLQELCGSGRLLRLDDGSLMNPRAERELTVSEKVSLTSREKRIAAAKKSWEIRKQNQQNCYALAMQSHAHSERDTESESESFDSVVPPASPGRKEEGGARAGGEGERLVLANNDFISDDGTVHFTAEEFEILSAECPDVNNIRGIVRHACRAWLTTVRPDERKEKAVAYIRKKQREGGTKTQRRAVIPVETKEQQVAEYVARRAASERAKASREAIIRKSEERKNGRRLEAGQFPDAREGGSDTEGEVSVPRV